MGEEGEGSKDKVSGHGRQTKDLNPIHLKIDFFGRDSFGGKCRGTL